MPKDLIIQESHYYSYQDEKHFYLWLEAIPGVKRVVGSPQGLRVQFKGNGLNRIDLCDLMSLLMRYGIDMQGLRSLVTPRNEVWMKDPQKYWYPRIFGNKLSKAVRAKAKARKKRSGRGNP